MSDEYQLRKDIDAVINDIYSLKDKTLKVVTFTDLLDRVHPIGSVYLTTNGQFNPNISFGGKWNIIDIGVEGVTAWERINETE